MSAQSSPSCPADRHVPVLLDLERRGPMTLSAILEAHPVVAWCGSSSTTDLRSWLSNAITHGWCEAVDDPAHPRGGRYGVTAQWRAWREQYPAEAEAACARLHHDAAHAAGPRRYSRCPHAVDPRGLRRADNVGLERVMDAAKAALKRIKACGKSRVAMRLEAEALARRAAS